MDIFRGETMIIEGRGKETKRVSFLRRNPAKETMTLVGVKLEDREKWTDWRQMIRCDDP